MLGRREVGRPYAVAAAELACADAGYAVVGQRRFRYAIAAQHYARRAEPEVVAHKLQPVALSSGRKAASCGKMCRKNLS